MNFYNKTAPKTSVLTSEDVSYKPLVVGANLFTMEHWKNLSLESIPGEEWRPITRVRNSLEALPENHTKADIQKIVHRSLGNTKGVNNGNALISEKQVKEVKKLIKNTNLSSREISEQLGVSYHTVRNIKKGGWKHIEV